MILMTFALLAANPTNFPAQLAAAKPGDTIAMAGEFGAVTIKANSRLTFTGLRAASLTVRGGTDLTFADTVISGTPAARHVPMVQVVDAARLRFTDLSVVSVPGPAGERNGYGVTVARSEDVAFDRLTVTGATKGMVLGASSNIAVRVARLTGLRSDGIQFGAVNGLLLEDVTVADLRPVRDGPVKTHDHADGIQATIASTDVTIRRFRFTDGADGQGIFISDARDPARYARIRIEGAVIAATHARCVSIDDADAVFVRDVTCMGVPGAAKPGIYLTRLTGLDALRTVAQVQVRDPGVAAERARTVMKP